MTRLCKNVDWSTWKFDPEFPPPSFEEFDREPRDKKNLGEKIYPENYPVEHIDVSDPELETPVQRGNNLWKQIKIDYKKKLKVKNENFERWRRQHECPESDEINLIEDEIFPTLMPSLVSCLRKANEKGVLRLGQFGMDAVDNVTEYMMTHNPRHPERLINKMSLFDYEKFQQLGAEANRRDYPRSWDWTKEKAALVLQSNIRGWLVRKRPEVQRLRKFWRNILIEDSPGARLKLVPSVDIKNLQELFTDLHLFSENRKGMSYVDAFRRKVTMWEQYQKKKEIEERIRVILSRASQQNNQEFKF